MKKTLGFCTTIALLSMAVGSARAGMFMNINFDADTVGSAPSSGPAGSPIATVQGFGGYDTDPLPVWDPGYKSPPTASCGTISVDNVAGMSKAAHLTSASTNGELGALWMDTSFSQSSAQLGLKFRISAISAPTSATAQPKYLNNTLSQAGIFFGINTYTSNGWAFRFAMAPTSAGGGVFAFRSADNSQLITFGNYVEGDTYDVALWADYSTGTVDAYINDVLAISGHPFWNTGVATPITTSEIFMHLNGEAGFANELAIDNIQAFNTPVPEPTSLALLGLGVVGFLARRRR